MQIHQLRYFISVAKHLNFTEAAKELFVAQSAVSQQIAHLEKSLNVQLFVRNKRSVQLTPAGSVFLKEAIELVKRSEEAVEKASKAEKGLIGSLKIGFLAGPVRSFLPRVLQSFTKKYPQIEIELHHLNLRELNEDLETFELDVIFTTAHGLEKFGGLTYTSLFSDTPCVFMSCSHHLANEKRLNLTDLAQENFILRDKEESPQWYEFTLKLCAKYGFYPKVVHQTRHMETVFMFIDAGLGMTILPNYSRMYASTTVQSIPIAGEEKTVEIAVCWNRASLNPCIPLFLKELEEFKPLFPV